MALELVCSSASVPAVHLRPREAGGVAGHGGDCLHTLGDKGPRMLRSGDQPFGFPHVTARESREHQQQQCVVLFLPQRGAGTYAFDLGALHGAIT